MSLRHPLDTRAAAGPLFGRFDVLEELGEGAYGQVVRAFDRSTHAEVALKILHRFGRGSLARFKNEFRVLADVVHPNIVRLGELFEQERAWAFSMELVRGTNFLEWVRPDDGQLCEPRLRAALAQLASALETLHRLKLLHRDIKPENVRVTEEGRVVLLDFGLATARQSTARTTGKQIVGTAGYMAPEQTRGDPATDKADIYALGVMLYRALTGVYPYEGDVFQVALLQRARPLAAPASLLPSLPRDLDELCCALLSLEPDQRPSALSLCERLGVTAPRIVASDDVPATRSELFVGRERELLELNARFDASTASGLQAVVVIGDSGLGKSTLVAQFARQLRRSQPRAWFLNSRCHFSEHVSYNAFDGIVDDLARLLSVLDDSERRALLPRRAFLLPALFPALAAVADTSVSPASESEPWGSIERIHLFDALLELLARVAERFPVVLIIDDLQWADGDSLQLLESMFDRAEALNLLLVLTARSGEIAERDDPHTRTLVESPRSHVMRLRTLSDGSARELGGRLLGLAPSSEQVGQLVDDSAGSPLFLIELAHARSQGAAGVSLDLSLCKRVAQLGDSRRRCVELLAVAGAPLSKGELTAAAQISSDELFRALALLYRERLVRGMPSGQLVCYHDRVREAVVSALSEESIHGAHAALATVFERAPFQSALRAAQHWLLAAEPARAAAWLEQAAAQAHSAAGYQQASELYRQRLELGSVPLQQAERRALQLALADSLACAGHCSESAHVLLAALEGGTREEQRLLILRAAQQLLQAGELQLGMQSAAEAMAQVDLPWRAHPAAALTHLAVYRLRIRVRQGRPVERAPAHASLASKQLETLVRLIQPLAWSDLLRSMELSARALLLALEGASSDYLPSCLAAEAVQATFRDPDGQQGRRLLHEARGWLSSESSSQERAYCAWASGAIAMLRTRYAESEKHLLEAEHTYRVHCAGEAWMLVNARGSLLSAWFLGGKHREFVTRGEAWLREAHAKGDAFALAYYDVGGLFAFRHVIADAPEKALAEVELVMKPWRATTWGVHHLLQAKAIHDILSYFGDARAHHWWNDHAKVPLVLPTYFAEGIAWRKAEATFRAGLSLREPSLIARAERLLQPLLRAKTGFVRVYAGLTAIQIAIFRGQLRDARKLAQLIREDAPKIDDFRTVAFRLLDDWLARDGEVEADFWEPSRAWFAEQGWTQPDRAMRWMLPLYDWLRASPSGAVPARAKA
jgi:eukaryotic-like serine/threonine-protein kinase